MDYISLFLVVAILFLLWLAAVAISTDNIRLRRHLPHRHQHLGTRHHWHW